VTTTAGLSSPNTGSRLAVRNRSSSRAWVVPGPTTVGRHETMAGLTVVTAAQVSNPNMPSVPTGPTDWPTSNSADCGRMTVRPLRPLKFCRCRSNNSPGMDHRSVGRIAGHRSAFLNQSRRGRLAHLEFLDQH
jgi:hypothetical protein